MIRMRSSNSIGAYMPLGKENVGMKVFVIDSRFAGKEDGGCCRRDFFDFLHQGRAIKTGHLQVTQHQVHAALI